MSLGLPAGLENAPETEWRAEVIRTMQNLYNVVNGSGDMGASASETGITPDSLGLSAVATSGLHGDLTLNDGTNPHGTTASDVGALSQVLAGTVAYASPANSIQALVQPGGYDLSVDYVAKHATVITGPVIVYYDTNIMADWGMSAQTLTGGYVVRRWQSGGYWGSLNGTFSLDLSSGTAQTLMAADSNGIFFTAQYASSSIIITGNATFAGSLAVMKATRLEG